jgi:hypothetical protein
MVHSIKPKPAKPEPKKKNVNGTQKRRANEITAD